MANFEYITLIEEEDEDIYIGSTRVSCNINKSKFLYPGQVVTMSAPLQMAQAQPGRVLKGNFDYKPRNNNLKIEFSLDGKC